MKQLTTLMLSMSLLTGLAQAAAGDQPLPPGLSDCLRVAGAVVACMDETPATGAPEMVASFGPPLGTGAFPVAPVLDPVLLGKMIGVAMLMETGLPDPGTPLFQNIPVSDLALSFNGGNAANPSIGVIFISEGNPAMTQWLSVLSSLPAGTVGVVPETGSFQDVTALLKTPYKVELASDIVESVPEPQSYALLGLGLAAIAAWVRHRQAR